MKPLFIRHVRPGSREKWWFFKAEPANFAGVIVLLLLLAGLLFPMFWLQRQFGMDSALGIIVFVSALLGGLCLLLFIIGRLSVTAEEYSKENKHDA